MSRAAFQYTKTILEKVSFNPKLFKRELDKAIHRRRLLPYEIKELKLWLVQFVREKPELQPCLLGI